jgi:hypothetical protein
MNGKLLPFEKKYEDLVTLAMQTRWMNREEAKKYVLQQMSQAPAWREKVRQLEGRS